MLKQNIKQKIILNNIDFKIYGFEAGMEFNQNIEIIKGQIIKDDEIKFNDYV